MVCASAILKRSLSEAIELQAMELAPDERSTWTGRDEQPLVPHRVRVLVTLGGRAAKGAVHRACVRAGLADLAGPVTDARQPRVGCLDVCERLTTALALRRSTDPGQVVELDRPQVGGMH